MKASQKEGQQNTCQHQLSGLTHSILHIRTMSTIVMLTFTPLIRCVLDLNVILHSLSSLIPLKGKTRKCTASDNVLVGGMQERSDQKLTWIEVFIEDCQFEK